MGCSSNFIKLTTSCLYFSDFIQVETFSDPVQIAFFVFPDLTDRKPNFSEFIPAQQTPVEEFSSTDLFFSNP